MSWNRTVHCGHCYATGHNKRGCPKLKQYAIDNPDSYVARQRRDGAAAAKNRRCSFCAKKGHNRRGCTEFKSMTAVAQSDSRTYRRNFLKYIKKMGLAPGALILRHNVEIWNRETREYSNLEKQVCQVLDILWDNVDWRTKDNEHHAPTVFRVKPVANLLTRDGLEDLRLSAHESADLPSDLRDLEYRGNRMGQWELASPSTASCTPPADFVNDISMVKEAFSDAKSVDYFDNKYED